MSAFTHEGDDLFCRDAGSDAFNVKGGSGLEFRNEGERGSILPSDQDLAGAFRGIQYGRKLLSGFGIRVDIHVLTSRILIPRFFAFVVI